MCLTILGITVCIHKAEAKETELHGNWRYANPDHFLEESRYRALLLQVGHPHDFKQGR